MLFLRGKTYYMDFVFEGQRVNRSCKTSDKKLAQAVEDAAREELIRSKYTGLKVTSMSLSEAIDKVYEDKWASNRSGKLSYQQATLASELLGNPQLSAIDQPLVSKLIGLLKKRKVAPSTINRYLAAIRYLMNVAWKEWGIISEVPHFPMSKEMRRHRVLSPEEEAKVLELIKTDEAKDIVKVLIDTGMRAGECLQLTGRYVDLEKRVIYVRNHLDQTTKSGKSRVVPMTTRVHAILSRRWNEEQLFQMDIYKLDKLWAAARKEMGLEDDDTFVVHALRHTAASRMVTEGADLYAVKSILGHASITTTEIYAELSVGVLPGAINVLEKFGSTETNCSENCNSSTGLSTGEESCKVLKLQRNC